MAEQRQVACAHPQRIAAVNAAAATAADIGASVGGSVGYSIAFEDIGTQVWHCSPACTRPERHRIMYMDPLDQC